MLRLFVPPNTRCSAWIVIPYCIIALFFPPLARAELPEGYFVWVKGDEGARETRRVYRMTLPSMDDIKPLTAGEDVECQISPGGKWVAYAKAKLPGSDYHQFNRFWLYIVSIHGAEDGREEIKIDDNGYWPSWGSDNTLYYSQVDPDDRQHTRIIKATLDEFGGVVQKQTLMATREHFPNFDEVNECFVAPDESWFAARTRGSESVNGTGGFSFEPAGHSMLARAGSVGCMPYVAPSSTWGFIAGRDSGIRWGHAPGVANRVSDALLVAPRSADGYCYHPGISTDEKWLMVGHGTDNDHNAGAYDIYLYSLDGHTATEVTLLAGGGFNGWPHLWVGAPSEPPPSTPHIDGFAPTSYTIVRGESVELHWETSFADAASLDGQSVAIDGSQTVQPDATTTYELTATMTGSDHMDAASVQITVNEEAMPVAINEFSIVPQSTVAGDSVTLSWDVANAYSLDLDGTAVSPVDGLSLNPLRTTTYTLTAQGHNGPAEESVTVTVTQLKSVKELLAERGGCTCTAGPRSHAAVLLSLLCFVAVFAARQRRGHMRNVEQI